MSKVSFGHLQPGQTAPLPLPKVKQAGTVAKSGPIIEAILGPDGVWAVPRAGGQLVVRQDDRIERIRHLEERADVNEKLAVEARLEAARLITEELDAGMSARALGKAIGKSHTHILRMARAWRERGGNPVSTLAEWNEVYHGEIEQQPQKAEREPAPGASRNGQPVDTSEIVVDTTTTEPLLLLAKAHEILSKVKGEGFSKDALAHAVIEIADELKRIGREQSKWLREQQRREKWERAGREQRSEKTLKEEP